MSTSTTWSKCPFSKDHLCKGEGLVIDGVVKGTRVHSVFVSGPKTVDVERQEQSLPTRFIALEIELSEAYPRIFRDEEKSDEVNYKANKKDSRKYIAPKLLDADSLCKLIGGSKSCLPDDFIDDRWLYVHPATKNRFELFVNERKEGAKDIGVDSKMRFRTFGSSVFVEHFENLTGNSNVFGKAGQKGAALSNQWTSAAQSNADKGALPGEDLEGVDSDEWSDE